MRPLFGAHRYCGGMFNWLTWMYAPSCSRREASWLLNDHSRFACGAGGAFFTIPAASTILPVSTALSFPLPVTTASIGWLPPIHMAWLLTFWFTGTRSAENDSPIKPSLFAAVRICTPGPGHRFLRASGVCAGTGLRLFRPGIRQRLRRGCARLRRNARILGMLSPPPPAACSAPAPACPPDHQGNNHRPHPPPAPSAPRLPFYHSFVAQIVHMRRRLIYIASLG